MRAGVGTRSGLLLLGGRKWDLEAGAEEDSGSRLRLALGCWVCSGVSLLQCRLSLTPVFKAPHHVILVFIPAAL